MLTSEDPEWYPGDDVVDIVGVDGYPTDKSDPLFARWAALLDRFNGRKLIALTEFGGVVASGYGLIRCVLGKDRGAKRQSQCEQRDGR